jgi:hypothetical protein
MSLLNRDPANPPDMCNPIAPEDVVSLWEWEFFSHFAMDSMDASIFDALEALQVKAWGLRRLTRYRGRPIDGDACRWSYIHVRDV